MSAPWWTFPRIDNFGTIDPQPGTGWKPDSNIQIPGLYPIENLLSGVVTSVQRTVWGQTVVTVKLDNPINSLATHSFYEHMSSSVVSVGQRVNAGDLIGYNNPSGQVPLGFGLYSGDVYGQGDAWTTLQNDLKPGGMGLLNPTSLLDAARSGNPLSGSTANTAFNVSTSGCAAWDIQCQLQNLFPPDWLQTQVNDTVHADWFQRSSLVFIGVVLALVGVLVLFVGGGAKIVEKHPEVLAAA